MALFAQDRGIRLLGGDRQFIAYVWNVPEFIEGIELHGRPSVPILQLKSRAAMSGLLHRLDRQLQLRPLFDNCLREWRDAKFRH